MALWFSASAVLPSLRVFHDLHPSGRRSERSHPAGGANLARGHSVSICDWRSHGRGLSRGYETRYYLGQGRYRPPGRTSGWRLDSRIGCTTSVQRYWWDRLAFHHCEHIASGARCRFCNQLCPHRTKPWSIAEIPSQDCTQSLYEPCTQARELWLSRSHVGALRDVGVARSVSAREF